MLYIVLAYLMLFAALTNSVCLNNASFFFLFKYFLCQGYELSGEIALKNNHYYYYYYYNQTAKSFIHSLYLDWKSYNPFLFCKRSLTNRIIPFYAARNLWQIASSLSMLQEISLKPYYPFLCWENSLTNRIMIAKAMCSPEK